MVGGSGFQPRFTRAIAVKNRSHDQKQQIQNYKVSLWNRFAPSFYKNRWNTALRYSTFIIRYSKFSLTPP